MFSVWATAKLTNAVMYTVCDVIWTIFNLAVT